MTTGGPEDGDDRLGLAGGSVEDVKRLGVGVLGEVLSNRILFALPECGRASGGVALDPGFEGAPVAVIGPCLPGEELAVAGEALGHIEVGVGADDDAGLIVRADDDGVVIAGGLTAEGCGGPGEGSVGEEAADTQVLAGDPGAFLAGGGGLSDGDAEGVLPEELAIVEVEGEEGTGAGADEDAVGLHGGGGGEAAGEFGAMPTELATDGIDGVEASVGGGGEDEAVGVGWGMEEGSVGLEAPGGLAGIGLEGDEESAVGGEEDEGVGDDGFEGGAEAVVEERAGPGESVGWLGAFRNPAVVPGISAEHGPVGVRGEGEEEEQEGEPGAGPGWFSVAGRCAD